jgi:hypothetical protein
MKVTATQDEIAAAFTEWERRYREEPERFMSEAARLLRETPETYGQACAPYLIQILNEQRRPTLHDAEARAHTGGTRQFPIADEQEG